MSMIQHGHPLQFTTPLHWSNDNLPFGIRPAPLQVGQVEPLLSVLKSNTEGFHLNPSPRLPPCLVSEEDGVLE